MTLEKTVQKNTIQVFKKMGYEHIGTNIELFGNSPKLDDIFKRQIERLNKEVMQ